MYSVCSIYQTYQTYSRKVALHDFNYLLRMNTFLQRKRFSEETLMSVQLQYQAYWYNFCKDLFTGFIENNYYIPRAAAQASLLFWAAISLI